MQTAEDVQRGLIAVIAAYLAWIKDLGGLFGVGEDNPWRTRLPHPYVCQRGLMFEIGVLPARDNIGARVTHTNHSVVSWYTHCSFHARDRRHRFMGCQCLPVTRPDLLAAYRLGGIDAIGSKSFVRNVITPANPNARHRYAEKPLYKSQYQEMLWDEWHRLVLRAAKEAGFDGRYPGH